jgi:hypothetical protein
LINFSSYGEHTPSSRPKHLPFWSTTGCPKNSFTSKIRSSETNKTIQFNRIGISTISRGNEAENLYDLIPHLHIIYEIQKASKTAIANHGINERC